MTFGLSAWMRMALPATGSALGVLGASALLVATPAAAQFRQVIPNDHSICRGEGPAVLVTVTGISDSAGRVRVQLYRGIESDWLVSGRWLSRIEMPAREGTMSFCMPVPSAGTYGIAVRHDLNGNGRTDLTSDGGAMSNNPSINIFNLGRPSYRKTAFQVGNEIKSITIRMRYM